MARRVPALALLGVALAVCAALAASESLTNRAGRTATAVTVTFSEQVRITSYDETVFPTKEPSSRSETFRFSGGQLENGARFSISWTPSTAEITTTEWETTGAASSGNTAGNTQLTYEQIMAQIAHYPGPDEPLYVPAEGEQIWLTDLEGHGDIYDNDSIKINYAPGFDKSQITRIDVNRNGVKMRFLPALFDVLTNDQMKTFDGNPEEHTPISSHTDHAIAGYLYSFRAYKGTSLVATAMAATVRSSLTLPFSPSVCLNNEWNLHMPASDTQLVSELSDLRGLGFAGIQIGADYFVATDTSTSFFPQYMHDESVCADWKLTPTETDIRRMLRGAEGAGMEAELRVELWVADAYCLANPGANRSNLHPKSLEAWFQNYTALCVGLAEIAEEEKAEVFCVGVELSNMQVHVSRWQELVAAVRRVFSGRVTFAEQTCGFLLGWQAESDWTRKEADRFWDAFDTIGMNSWSIPMADNADGRYRVMTERFVAWWAETVKYYRSAYPGKPLGFNEVGHYSYDGAATGEEPAGGWGNVVVDLQEPTDLWGAQIAGMCFLGLDHSTVWVYEVATNDSGYHECMTLNALPALKLVVAALPR